MAFSTAGISSCRRTGSFIAITNCARPSALAAPPMSFFIWRIDADGLMSSPPVSKHTPLPTRVRRGCFGAPQFSSISRGARSAAAARPTACTAGKPCLSSASPVITRHLAPKVLASARAASASSAGPMCSAGVLTRSRVRAMASAIACPFRPAADGGSCNWAGGRFAAL